MLCKLEDWLEGYPMLEDMYYWLWRNTIEVYKSKKRMVKWAYQRLVNGYDEGMYWNPDQAITMYSLPLIKKLRENVEHGCPVDLTPTKWKNIINKIIYSMEQTLTESDYPECECKNCLQRKKASFSFQDLKDGKLPCLSGKKYMFQVKKYNKRVQEGFTLFGKYYQNLWD